MAAPTLPSLARPLSFGLRQLDKSASTDRPTDFLTDNRDQSARLLQGAVLCCAVLC